MAAAGGFTEDVWDCNFHTQEHERKLEENGLQLTCNFCWDDPHLMASTFLVVHRKLNLWGIL
jgi:hypothetical protein